MITQAEQLFFIQQVRPGLLRRRLDLLDAGSMNIGADTALRKPVAASDC
jgi:hypothetical protein